MFIASRVAPLHQTRHSRELARRVEQAVRDYQRENPDITESEVRTALLQSAPGGDFHDQRRRKLVVMAAAVLVGGTFAMLATTSGRGFETGTAGWRILGAAAAAAGLAIALIRVVRRS